MTFTPEQLAPQGPPEPVPQASSSENSAPVFRDGLRASYDLEFRKLNASPEASDPDSSLTFPSPVGFTSKDQYYEAVRAWKKRVAAHFAGSELPVQVLSFSYRPKPPLPFCATDPEARRIRPDKAPPMSKNFNKLFEILLTGEEFDPDAEFPDQIPRRNPIRVRYHINSERQWQSGLVPGEPVPQWYNTFEEYSDAYKNWCRAAKAGMSVRIPGPREFAPILKLNIMAEHTGMCRNSAGSGERERICDFSWVDTVKDKKFSHQDKIAGLLAECRTPKMSSAPSTCLVFGVDQAMFVEQMTETGVYQPSMDATRPVYPFSVLEMRSQRGAVDAIVDLVMNDSITEEQLIFQLMKIDFDMRDFKWAMEKRKKKHRTHRVTDNKNEDAPKNLQSHSPAWNERLRTITVLLGARERTMSSGEDDVHVAEQVPRLRDYRPMKPGVEGARQDRGMTIMEKAGKHRKGRLVLRMLRERLTPGNIIKSLFIGKHSPDLRAKMSIFLCSLVNTKFGPKLFDQLLTPKNLDALYETVAYLVALANFQLLLISPSSENEFAVKLSQFHLLSSLLMDTDAVTFLPFRRYIQEKCRMYSLDIGKMIVANPEIREDLWASLMSDTSNDKAKLMNMVALSPVVNFSRLILSSDFLRKGNQVSKFAIGKRFLLRMMYNDNSFNTAFLFVRSPIPEDEPFTDYFIMILRYMIAQLQAHLSDHKLVYETSPLVALFKAGEISHRVTLLPTVATILSTKEVAQRANQTSYQKKLVEICQSVIASDADRVDIMRILCPFTVFVHVAMPFAQTTNSSPTSLSH